MKNLKIMSIVVIIGLVAIWSCSKNNTNPDVLKQVPITNKSKSDKIYTDASSARHTGHNQYQTLEQFIRIAKIIANNQHKVVRFDLEYDERTDTWRRRNMRIEHNYVIPPGFDPSTETVTVECTGGDADGDSTTCSDTDCVNGAVTDCVYGGGCATICPARLVSTIRVFPKGLL